MHVLLLLWLGHQKTWANEGKRLCLNTALLYFAGSVEGSPGSRWRYGSRNSGNSAVMVRVDRGRRYRSANTARAILGRVRPDLVMRVGMCSDALAVVVDNHETETKLTCRVHLHFRLRDALRLRPVINTTMLLPLLIPLGLSI
jgi:hypothetical protein